ncbi:hypothetical protein MtrunA17_Chr4g0007731 [Medicago truncatula]|uniref:Uncharacterized protein n=1 Tax=Medicago truncatula TaxID=3880 RepID=I3S917_MEDTR|nr:unknown [Medicago truncatula]RHN58934.1 hypothetical protein MtrunA17_Chr4g0007731 [Medicago truncatula]
MHNKSKRHLKLFYKSLAIEKTHLSSYGYTISATTPKIKSSMLFTIFICFTIPINYPTERRIRNCDAKTYGKK